jgi:tetratricopeptide (TPR) repeat protein
MPSRPSPFLALLTALAMAAGPARAARAQPAKATAPASASFASLSAHAAKAREAGQTEEAVRLYREALRAKPSWSEGRWSLATLLYEKDRLAEALEQFQRLAAERPRQPLVLALAGLCEARLGRTGPALEHLLAARAIGIPSPEVRPVASFQAATLLLQAGDPDGAFEILREFARSADDRPAVIEAFGLALLRLRDAPGQVPVEKREMVLLAGRAGYDLALARRGELARMALEELVSRYPTEPNVHYAQGSWLLNDDPAAAIEAFRQELALSPKHHVAMIQLAFAELKRGRPEEALPMAEQAVALAPETPAAHLALAQALLASGQTERGVQEAERAVRLAPENPRLRYALVQAYQQAGRAEDAARERREFLKLQPGAGTAPAPDAAATSRSPGGNSHP